MSIRHLEALFQPGAVAVVGASDRPGSVGAVVLRNLLEGGFNGPVWPVNARHDMVGGARACRSVADLPGVPDLAVICTPAPTVPGLIAELGRLGCRAAVVLSAGLKHADRPGGPTLEQQMLDAARPHLLRVLGRELIDLHLQHLRRHRATLADRLLTDTHTSAAHVGHTTGADHATGLVRGHERLLLGYNTGGQPSHRGRGGRRCAGADIQDAGEGRGNVRHRHVVRVLHGHPFSWLINVFTVARKLATSLASC